MNNFLKWLALVPYVLAGVAQIHAEAPSETKSTIALQALGLADGTAVQGLNTSQAALANSIATTIASGIDAFTQKVK